MPTNTPTIGIIIIIVYMMNNVNSLVWNSQTRLTRINNDRLMLSQHFETERRPVQVSESPLNRSRIAVESPGLASLNANNFNPKTMDFWNFKIANSNLFNVTAESHFNLLSHRSPSRTPTGSSSHFVNHKIIRFRNSVWNGFFTLEQYERRQF